LAVASCASLNKKALLVQMPYQSTVNEGVCMRGMKWVLSLVVLAAAAGCATPTVVQSKQSGDTSMSCDQLKAAYAEALDFETKARKERGLTGTNVAAAVFFWPAMIGTYKNTEEAIDAAKERQKYIEKLGDSKSCKVV
jgi:hypothetical protein